MKVKGKKRIVISGYYGFHNLGDEAVLEGMLCALKSSWQHLNPHAGEMEIVVLSNCAEETEKTHGTKAVNRWQLGKIYRTLKEASLLISGGGGLLQDVTGLKSLFYYLGIVWLALKLKKPVVFYAQGIGPIRTAAGRFLVRRIVNRAKVVIVRDAASKEDLLALGVKNPPIYVTVDAALGLPLQEVKREKGEEILKSLGLEARKPCAGIAVRSWPGFSKKKQEAIARFADELVARGWEVVFLPFHYPEDLVPSKSIALLMREKGTVLEKRLSWKEMASVVSCLGLVVGMRLHALVFAALFGVPFMAISYDPKIDRFLDQLGLKPATSIEELELSHLQEALESLFKEGSRFEEKLKEKVALLREKAKESAFLALRALERRAQSKGA